MKFKGMPGLVVNDGKNKVEFPYSGILELKGKEAKWLKGLIDSGRLKNVKVLDEEKPEELQAEEKGDKG